jgi:hypothetical protein
MWHNNGLLLKEALKNRKISGLIGEQGRFEVSQDWLFHFKAIQRRDCSSIKASQGKT